MLCSESVDRSDAQVMIMSFSCSLSSNFHGTSVHFHGTSVHSSSGSCCPGAPPVTSCVALAVTPTGQESFMSNFHGSLMPRYEATSRAHSVHVLVPHV